MCTTAPYNIYSYVGVASPSRFGCVVSLGDMRLPEPFLLRNITVLLPALKGMCAASSMRIVDCCESPECFSSSRDHARAQEERTVTFQSGTPFMIPIKPQHSPNEARWVITCISLPHAHRSADHTSELGKTPNALARRDQRTGDRGCKTSSIRCCPSIGGSTTELMDIVTESVNVAMMVGNPGSSRGLVSFRRARRLESERDERVAARAR
ncbi:hypothetical protein BJV78DRAFT_808465 [Lactifluus subvellereus]|nr:hypothetical protein BJV78DRAFT_808465 [Lactifluus subvellereus]